MDTVKLEMVLPYDKAARVLAFVDALDPKPITNCRNCGALLVNGECEQCGSPNRKRRAKKEPDKIETPEDVEEKIGEPLVEVDSEPVPIPTLQALATELVQADERTMFDLQRILKQFELKTLTMCPPESSAAVMRELQILKAEVVAKQEAKKK